MKLSVIIPVLNERGSLPATIAALRACHGIAEIIVADGGSTDDTVAWLQAQAEIVLVRSIRGKGPQINVGAAAAFDVPGTADISETVSTETSAKEPPAPATAAAEAPGTATAETTGTDATETIATSGAPDICLLFLHADCLVSQAAIDALHAVLADPQLVGGAFYLRFAESRPRSL